MRGSDAARSTPTAPPMLWPAYAIRVDAPALERVDDAAEVFHLLGGTRSSKRPSEPPLPANDTRSDARPAADSASASATSQGRSLCAVTPWASTTMRAGRGRVDRSSPRRARR